MLKFPTLILHIGAGKTGSTSIQFSLRQAESALVAQKTMYTGLMLERVPGAERFSWCVEGAPHRYFQAQDREKSNEEVYRTILHELTRQGKLGVRQVIWSNEAFLTRHDRILPVISQLRRDGVPIRLICYVRRHDKWARSAYVQFGLKFKSYPGPIRDFKEWAANQDIAYGKDLEIWRTACPDLLELYNFDEIKDVAAHFLRLCDLTDIDIIRANDRPSNALLAAWAVFNGSKDTVVRPNAFTKLAAPLKIIQPRGKPVPPLENLLPDQNDLQAIQEVYSDDLVIVNAILKEQGEPPMEYGELEEKSQEVSSWEIDRMLLQMVFSLQRQVLELQRALDEQNSEPGAS